MSPNRVSPYSPAGLNNGAAVRAKNRVRELARSTFTNGVLSDAGLASGVFRPDLSGMDGPVLVSSAGGVGAKLRVAAMMGAYDTVGADLVNRCVNDILAQGAAPLFFMDYLATSRGDPYVVEKLVAGVVAGCRENGCALIGGETAETHGVCVEGEYDLAGFVVGVADGAGLIDGSAVRPGDAVMGLASSGLHTDGYTLAEKIFFDRLKLKADSWVERLDATVGEELLKPHRGYLSLLRPCLKEKLVSGVAHITGGGLVEKIPRALPAGCSVELDRDGWPVPPVFDFMAELGNVGEMEMYGAFNMGVGMAAMVHPDLLGRFVAVMKDFKEPCYEIGRVVEGDRKVVFG